MFKLRNRSLARLLCSPLPKQTQRGSLPSCRRRYSHRARVSEAAAVAAVKQVPRPATTLVSRRVPPPPRLCSPSSLQSLAVALSKGQLESAAWPAVAHGRRPRHPTRASKQAFAGHLASILSLRPRSFFPRQATQRRASPFLPPRIALPNLQCPQGHTIML